MSVGGTQPACAGQLYGTTCTSITTLADYFDVKHRAADPNHATPPPPPPRDPVDDDSPEDEARD